ncbi:MAG: hypothetical protein H6810_00915 [Phycisphaeraceae bacterium]|nr:MAG: hypothetical protein H6810_00915 [Phycisphaeraceae bacterium]
MPRMLERWTQGRVPIGLRWWITRSGEIRPGWPAPGLEHTTLGMGWIAYNEAVGVIEHPLPPVDIGLLDMLDERFPNRRWFAGAWVEEAAAVRKAA